MLFANYVMFFYRVLSMIQSIRGLFLELYKIYSITFTIWMKIWNFTLRFVSTEKHKSLDI